MSAIYNIFLLFEIQQASTQDREGNTPLHLACMNSDKACVDALTLPITPEDLKQFHNSECIPQVLPLDLEQRNYQGKRLLDIFFVNIHFKCQKTKQKKIRILLVAI